jgi:hypothetical protein
VGIFSGLAGLAVTVLVPWLLGRVSLRDTPLLPTGGGVFDRSVRTAGNYFWTDYLSGLFAIAALASLLLLCRPWGKRRAAVSIGLVVAIALLPCVSIVRALWSAAERESALTLQTSAYPFGERFHGWSQVGEVSIGDAVEVWAAYFFHDAATDEAWFVGLIGMPPSDDGYDQHFKLLGFPVRDPSDQWELELDGFDLQYSRIAGAYSHGEFPHTFQVGGVIALIGAAFSDPNTLTASDMTSGETTWRLTCPEPAERPYAAYTTIEGDHIIGATVDTAALTCSSNASLDEVTYVFADDGALSE